MGNRFESNPDINIMNVANKNQLSSKQENKALKLVLDSLAEGVIVADKDGNFIYFNSVAEKILGIGVQNITPAEWTSVYGCYYPDNKSPYPSEQLPLAKAIRGEEMSDELIFIKNPMRPEGIYISVTASPLRDAKGKINGGTVIFRDVTRDIQAELLLRESEDRVKAQFKGFPIPTYVWQHIGDDFILVDYNDAAKVFTKGKIEGFLGIKLSKMYQDSTDYIPADIWRCYREKKSFNREMTYQLKTTGEYKELNAHYVLIAPELVSIHTEDITDRKQTEKELRKLSSAVEQTADSVVITNKQGIIEYVNPAFETTTGYNRDEVIGATPKILKSGMHDAAFYKKLWGIILKGKPYQGTIVNKKKNGEAYWCQQTISSMKDASGEITHFVSVIKDITDLKERQEQEMRLNIAREIQQRLYKNNISIPGFDIAGETHSALETSGDYFDFISTSDGYTWMIIADVCGHGIGSALIMAQTRAYLHAFAKMKSDPGIILTWLNQELVSFLDEYHFVTMLLARLDTEQNILDYAGAGHVPAYLLDASGNIKEVMKSTGIPLGYLREEKYTKSKRIKLHPGDIAVFLTDGIMEAHKSDEQEFGDNGALGFIKNNRHASAKTIIKQLHKKVLSFYKKQAQEDDITSIICKVASTR